jgi:transposase
MFIQRYCVFASPTEQAQLARVARQGTTPQKIARRARLVWMLSHHESPSAVARTLHVSRMTVRLWALRFVTNGVPGVLREASRPGRRKQLSPAKVQAIVDATLTTRPPAGTHWSSRRLAKAQGVSDGTIRKIWRQHGLQPHRVGRFKLSTDPHFVEKLRDVVGLYVNPPAKAVVFCVDEKSGIQALDRTCPVLPLRPGVPERQTHDYVRHGTTTLYAALRVLDGVVIGECRRRHRSQEFIQFLRRLERATPPDQALHLILDNLSAHKSPHVRRWLTRHPRVHFHFVPTSSSWLNLVERWFAEITRTRLRRGTFTSVPALERAIHEYLTHYNQQPKPFVWTKGADTILAKIDRCKEALNAPH